MFWVKAIVLSRVKNIKSSFLVILFFVSSFRFQVFGTRMILIRLGETLVFTDFSTHRHIRFMLSIFLGISLDITHIRFTICLLCYSRFFYELFQRNQIFTLKTYMFSFVSGFKFRYPSSIIHHLNNSQSTFNENILEYNAAL